MPGKKEEEWFGVWTVLQKLVENESLDNHADLKEKLKKLWIEMSSEQKNKCMDLMYDWSTFNKR
jgi:hypothetical protein